MQKGVGKKNKPGITYPSIPLAIQQTLHSDVSVFTELSPSEEESIDEMLETDDVTLKIPTDSERSFLCYIKVINSSAV